MKNDNEYLFKKLEDEGILVNTIASLGWGFWLPNGQGYLDEHSLRIIADEIERRNKPFWDEYEQYCRDNPPPEPSESFDFLCETFNEKSNS